jgi:hypothetical protein
MDILPENYANYMIGTHVVPELPSGYIHFPSDRGDPCFSHSFHHTRMKKNRAIIRIAKSCSIESALF